MSTVHIGANKEDIAKTVLMPGDPLRSRFIAENFLEDYRLVNNIRGVQGYTGFYNGKKVTVMASGMGMPSIGIYSYELFNYFDVEAIIRVGSAGAVDESVKIRDVVLGQAACTNGNYASQFRLPGTVAPIADFGLLMKAYETAVKWGLTSVWVICFPAIISTTIRRLRSTGRKWAFLRLKWKLPRFISTLSAQRKRLSLSVR